MRSMFHWEIKLWNWIGKHRLLILIIVSTIISLIIRYSMRHYLSRDMTTFLLPWYESIRSRGGILALGVPVGNYNIPYQTLISIMTYIPVKPEYMYKILSMIFDFLQAFLVYKIIILTSHKRWHAAMGYIIAINLPIVLLNSALWGQCDSIFTCFCILSLYLCLKERYVWAFIAVGAAFAFKLQAVFFIPFLLFLYVYKKRFSFLNFLWIPIVMIITSAGGILQGQPISAVFQIYFQQTQNGNMSVNYPSIWAMMIPNFQEEYYSDMHIYGMLLTILILLVLMVILMHIGKKKQYSSIMLLEISFLFVYTCVFFLPNMHERYGYLYIVLGLIMIIVDWRMVPSYIALLLIDIIIYANYLFGLTPNWQILSVINAVCYCSCVFLILKKHLLGKRNFELQEEKIS